jgi:hypothetical protein
VHSIGSPKRRPTPRCRSLKIKVAKINVTSYLIFEDAFSAGPGDLGAVFGRML